MIKGLTLFTLKTYKFVVSPILEVLFGKACKYPMTCSEYSIEIIDQKGVYKGGKLAIMRFLSCNSWSGVFRKNLS